jgi:hypothetical protein
MKAVQLLPVAFALAGCALFFPCEDRPDCNSSVIAPTKLDPSLVGAVEFTIRRKDLRSEQVTCRWQATTASADGGAVAARWGCDPAPDRSDSSAVEYDAILVQKTDYELVLTGPAGVATLPIEQKQSYGGEECGCHAIFQIPESAWAQVGAQ